MSSTDCVKQFSDDVQRRALSRRTLSRFLTLIENENPEAQRALDRLSSGRLQAYRIGLTGPPGAGKSTLVNAWVRSMDPRETVAVIAVDPTSPFSGGAILGDRVRMVELGSLENVFVRSLASRGAMGGLARTAQKIADALDVAGFQTILFETMGVGQAEIDISRHADTVVVTLVPESGDGVQAMKAGMMEIADIFLLNKSDRAQADQIRQDLLTAIQLRHNDEWTPPVIKTIATQDAGVDEIIAAVDNHRRFQNQSGRLEQRRKDRIKFQLRQEIQHVWTAMLGREDCQAAFEREVAAIHGGEATLQNAAERLLKVMIEGNGMEKALKKVL